MPRLPVPGADIGSWGTLINGFLTVAHHPDGTLKSTHRVFNVQDHGARGDGTTDDTVAIRQTITAMQAAGGGTLYFPTGNYLVTGTLRFATQQRLEIVGNGLSSNILWAFDGNLFEWQPQVSCAEVTVCHLRVDSVQVAKSAASAAFSCRGGAERALFDHLHLVGSGFRPGTGIEVLGVTDSTTIRDCQFWEVLGTGIRIGHGSEVRILGGRIIGNFASRSVDNSFGIHMTGGNGGVHVMGTDIIGLTHGMRIEDITSSGSNREVFITHATLDSCWRGLELWDDTYVSMVGCWAASCDQENIHVNYGLNLPILAISGGTIFNAGAMGGSPATGQNGITVNSGTFSLTGVNVRNNRGKGVWIPNNNVREYTITGCRIADNGRGLLTDGSGYIVTNNVFARNTQPNTHLGTNFRVADNVNA